ncbi:hypothetical protein JXQ70_14585 [bacterium]|nr:hypothetical protein [bacterium]
MDEKLRKVVLETLETIFSLQLKSVRQLLNFPDRDLPGEQAAHRRTRKRKSLADLSLELLTESDAPLHINELVDLLQQRFGRVTDRDSLSSTLAKKVKKGVIKQVAPACYTVNREAKG